MCAAATIPTVRSAHRGKFIPHKMFTPRSAMAATAKNADMVDKITFLQNCIFTNDSPAFVGTAAGKTQRYLNQKQTQIMRYILLLLALPSIMATQCSEYKK